MKIKELTNKEIEELVSEIELLVQEIKKEVRTRNDINKRK